MWNVAKVTKYKRVAGKKNMGRGRGEKVVCTVNVNTSDSSF